VSSGGIWNVFSGPGAQPERAADHFVASPFTRLARVHALMIAGDALIALALANSLFFSIDPDAARNKVALYLLLTMAPFAVVAPLIGPALDRATNGRRLMVVAISVARFLVGLLMIGHLNSLLLFPEAFLMLVLGKGYGIAKSAMVPTTVKDDQELVEANSKLSIITALTGVVAGIPGLLLGWLGGPEWIVGLAVVVFAVSAIFALSLAPGAVADEPPDEAEETELRSRGIFLAASAMGLMRGIVGFLVFLLAFEYQEQPTWMLGLAVGASVLGSFVGSILAPRVRRTTHEEDILTGSLILAAAVALLGAWSGGLGSAMLVAFAIGFSANTAKLAFDSIVQRDAPDANRGRSFARFETRFQVWWVIGAFIPVVLPILKIPLPEQAGFLIIAFTAGFAAVTYWIGRRDAAAGRAPKAKRAKRPPKRTTDAAPDDPTGALPEPTMVDDFLPPPDSTLLDELDDDITTVDEPTTPPPGPERKPRPRTDPAAARRAPGPNRRRRRPTQRPRRPPP
jgi:MFS family permease